ncbi:acyclic terpene utilization AtuA family protein [Actinoallomurus sp. CA-150999]|uniref:acyclic terpene utilization AtuA family protein n=1 Tax=Actinoallomurus sp. CA-150999 TaxID=3239887 RepID=UPI003D9239DF
MTVPRASASGQRGRTVRVGCGAGFAGDRVQPAVGLVDRGELDYLVLECLAERTTALGQLRRLADPAAGYDPSLDRRMRLLLKPLARTGTRLVTNIGSADPLAAARRVLRIAAELAVPVSVAAVTGDDVLDRIDVTAPAWEDGRPLVEHGELVSASAYLGADALLPALRSGAQVVIGGRIADPSLFVAPLAHEFGWSLDDVDRIAGATTIGHLLECGGQVTGGYFADPPYKTVPDLAGLGYPIAEVDEGAAGVVTKLPGTGGRVDRMTVAEQLAYEVTDPRAYLTPDVTADFTTVRIRETGPDRVRVTATTGAPRPPTLKVSVGYRAGFRCEAEISYAGATALHRARLAGQVVADRLDGLIPRLRADYIGATALHGDDLGGGAEPYECRLRIAGIAPTRDAVEAIGHEVTALYTTGPAGGGGVRVTTEEVIGIVSTSIERSLVEPRVHHPVADR